MSALAFLPFVLVFADALAKHVMRARRQRRWNLVASNPDVIERLTRLGDFTEDRLKYWRNLWISDGEKSFWYSLRADEETAEEYRQWFPKLQEFAAARRREVPAPDTGSFTAAEQEQYRILLAKMTEFAASEDRRCVFGHRPHRAAILSTTRIGLTAAQQVFDQTKWVILTAEELGLWYDIYPRDPEKFWWEAYAWWSLHDGLLDDGIDAPESLRNRYPIPEGSSYWVVISGVSWGPQAGGVRHELWRWDGVSAEFIDTYCDIDF